MENRQAKLQYKIDKLKGWRLSEIRSRTIVAGSALTLP